MRPQFQFSVFSLFEAVAIIIPAMAAEITIDGHLHRFDLSDPIDISIPLQFNGPQPNAYGVAPATSSPCVAGDLIGDTRQGGSCNFEAYTLVAHCNGTHTECVGHITHERIAITDSLKDIFMTAALISVEAKAVSETEETYSVSAESDDWVITRGGIERFLRAHDESQSAYKALIVRTLPNDASKRTREYIDRIPPYFTTEAMQHIVELGIEHLVVDVPSVDRLYDEGRLSNHRMFWKVEQGSFELSEIARRHCTVTELAFVPDDVSDGRYLLNLQIAPFASDASPSRPILFRLIQN